MRLQIDRMHAEDCAECTHTTEGYAHRIQRTVILEGNLSAEQHQRLQEIARKCPVHKILTSEIVISDLKDAGDPILA